MAKSPNPLGSPNNLPIPLPEVDSLYGTEISEEQKNLKDAENKVRIIKSNLRNLRIKENEAKGIEPAFATDEDLIVIIGDMLTTGCPVSRAFDKREGSSSQCKSWAKRAIRGRPDEVSILNALAGISSMAKDKLELMKKHKRFNIAEMANTDSYSKALNKMKKQLIDATLIQQYIDENSSLKAQLELANNVRINWKERAIILKKRGLTHTEIAHQVGRGRNTVSTHLNRPEVKSQWPA